MNTIEMHGFLTGKCLQGDMRVNETTAEYLVRKFREKDEQLAAVVAERDALAAENAALRKFCRDASFDADYEAELGMERGGFADALNDIKTPTTDAAVREIEARGVEKFAVQQDKLADEYRKLSPGCYGEKSSAKNALMARAFAAALREHSQEVERG